MPDTPPQISHDAAVDVVIAAWNRSETIERAVLSVAGEPEVRSVIVVDDASTDDTADRVRRLAQDNQRINLIRMDRNGGPSIARNRALDVSTAPWVAILDGDDFMTPGRLGRLLARAEGWDFVADDLFQIIEGEAFSPSARSVLEVDETWPERIELETFVLGNISRRGRGRREMGFLKPLMRRAFLDKHGLRYAPPVRLGEDYLLYAHALAARARYRLMPAAGYVSVVRAASLSGSHTRRDLEALLASDRTIAALPNLTAGERYALRRHCRNLEGKIQWLVTIEAVKERSLGRFLGVFAAAPSVSLYVLGQLLEQALIRSTAPVARLLGRSHV